VSGYNRLRVLLTATDEHGHSGHSASQATQPVAAAQAPVAEQLPPVTGAALAGHTLTVQTGVFAGEGPLSYTYQWERCGAAGCQTIAGATQSSYILAEGDVSSTVLALVTATDANGATTAVSSPTALAGPEALLELSSPSISGVVQSGGTLSADPGIWSASGPVSYAYQWQRCNPSGEACTSIEGAREPTYAPVGADLGSTLRVTVTVTSPLGTKSAVSAHTAATLGGEVSVEEAQGVVHQSDPAVLSPSTMASLEEQSIAPTLSDTGEELASHSTLTTSKETAGEFAVNTPVGELSLTPVESLATAATPATIVNGTVALFANIWPATDTIIRPEPLGATALLQIRSTEAPRSFSWEARLGPDQELKQLPDDSVAVVEASEEAAQPSGGQEAGEAGPLRGTNGGPPETTQEKTEAEQEAAQPETEEEVPLESLPASPQSNATPGEASAGKPSPQQTQAAYETAKTAMAFAESQTAGKALMTIAPPNVTDAEGHTVPASLSVTGDTLTLAVKPGAGVAFPLLADTTIAASSDKASATRDPVRFGISDPVPEKKGHLNEHFDENGNNVPGFDPNLKNGPLHTDTARLIVPWDVMTAKSAYATSEKHRLETWLHKIHELETAGPKLQPYITIGKDFSTQHCGEEGITTCPMPSVPQYKKGTEKLMRDLIHGNKARGLPPVELWGAWNEPDAGHDPLHHHAPRAAHFWEVSQSILANLAKQYHCKSCTVVAGEFAYPHGFEPNYTSLYRNTLLCRPHGNQHCSTRYWSKLPGV